DLDGQAEPVEQLGAEFALLGVHRADEHEPCGVFDREAVTFDTHAAGGRGVQQQVDEVVRQQVDLVDVEQTAVGSGQQAGLELHDALTEGLVQLQRAGDPVVAGTGGEFDKPYGTGDDVGVRPERAVGGNLVGIVWVDGEAVALVDGHRWEDFGETTDRRRFRRALLAAYQDAADEGIDRGECQGECLVFGADDGGKWLQLWHLVILLELRY